MSEDQLGYFIFCTGWPILILASLWIKFKAANQTQLIKNLTYISLLSFYTLGYTCTMYWLGEEWMAGVLPAFLVFLILIIWLLMVVKKEMSK